MRSGSGALSTSNEIDVTSRYMRSGSGALSTRGTNLCADLGKAVNIQRLKRFKPRTSFHYFTTIAGYDCRATSFSLNVFIANIKQGVGPQVFPTLVTALPLQYTYKALHRQWRTYLCRGMRFPAMRYMRPAKAQTSLRIRAV